MDPLLMVSVSDFLKSKISGSMDRINEINSTIIILGQEKHQLALEVEHGCHLLKAIIEDDFYKEKVVESVIESHKELIDQCMSAVKSIIEREGD